MVVIRDSYRDKFHSIIPKNASMRWRDSSAVAGRWHDWLQVSSPLQTHNVKFPQEFASVILEDKRQKQDFLFLYFIHLLILMTKLMVFPFKKIVSKLIKNFWWEH